jgi:hydroxyacylglutathione hydrolase
LLKYNLFCLLNGFDTNAYLVWDDVSREAVLVDPAEPSETVSVFISEHSLIVKYIVNTHGHGDHIGGNEYFRIKLNAKTCIHCEDAHMLNDARHNLSIYFDNSISQPAPDILFNDGDEINLGNSTLKVIHTPGHTKGCICLRGDNLLISGDTLFFHDIGRTDLPGGNHQMILSSIRKKLLVLPDETIVLPGHGPASTIADEKQNNPYI